MPIASTPSRRSSHLLPRGGACGSYHHDPHGGRGAHAHRHLQARSATRGRASRRSTSSTPLWPRRARQRSRHRGALPGAALGHHGGLLHRLLRAPRRHAHRLAHRALPRPDSASASRSWPPGLPPRATLRETRPPSPAGAQGRQAHSAGARPGPCGAASRSRGR